MIMLKTLALFSITALAEIIGCYLPYLWLKEGKSIWLLVPAAFSLALYAWLLTLHDQGSAGRLYAVYGGIYVAFAVFWMWGIEKIRPDRWDYLGVAIIFTGCAVIYFAPHSRNLY